MFRSSFSVYKEQFTCDCYPVLPQYIPVLDRCIDTFLKCIKIPRKDSLQQGQIQHPALISLVIIFCNALTAVHCVDSSPLQKSTYSGCLGKEKTKWRTSLILGLYTLHVFKFRLKVHLSSCPLPS